MSRSWIETLTLVTPVSSVAPPARLTVSEPSVGATKAIVVSGALSPGYVALMVSRPWLFDDVVLSSSSVARTVKL